MGYFRHSKLIPEELRFISLKRSLFISQVFFIVHVHSPVLVTLEEIKGVGTSGAFLQGRWGILWDLVVGYLQRELLSRRD